MFTFLTGLVLLGRRHAGLTAEILVGSLLATLVFLNFWLIIWPNQRILIASNHQIKAGGQANLATNAAVCASDVVFVIS